MLGLFAIVVWEGAVTVPTIDVDLTLPPAQRWHALRDHKAGLRHLISTYVNDIGGVDALRDELTYYKANYVASDYAAEMDAIAALGGMDPLEVLLANVYYDAFKHAMGCTAFAVDTPDGPLHARNLDWWTERNALSRETIIARFHKAGTVLFEAVTWPGFVGVLSGVAHGRFSVTLRTRA